MRNFKLWINESFTDNSEKLNQIARRIWANVTAQTNQASKKEDFKTFQMWGMGRGMHHSAVYHWLTQRMSGKEEQTPENNQQISDMTNQMANAPAPPETQYTKGAGWHHWIINGDMDRGTKGTDKTYISVHYKSLIPNAQAVMSAILKNLASNGYNDFQHFMKNIQNHFQPNGPFVQKLQKIL